LQTGHEIWEKRNNEERNGEEVCKDLVFLMKKDYAATFADRE
jgi:hypothetical protein